MALPRHVHARGGRTIDDSDLQASVGSGLTNRPDDVMKVEFGWSDGKAPIIIAELLAAFGAGADVDDALAHPNSKRAP